MSRYRALRRIARRLTDGDAQAADDLLHDAYVQFVAARPDLGGIEHLDGYLTTLLRNLHVSRLRRRANQHDAHVAIEEYDSIERALEQVDAHQLVAARDALVRVCRFACQRKATSKGAAILVLRSFHGFYPTEIERMACAPARTVRRLLAEARDEARAAVGRLRPRDVRRDDEAIVTLPPLTATDPEAVVRALREAIFDTRTPPCPRSSVIHGWYRPPFSALDTGDLAHVVSCRRCLTTVCAALGLSPPDERSPLEPPDDEAGGNTARGAPDTRPLQKAKRRGLRDLLEHRPRELQITVNGLPMGVLRATADDNHVRWTIRTEEAIAFVEVHSEQGQRMLLLPVAPLGDGGVLQRARISLTHGRWMEATLDFRGVYPALVVQYVVPSDVAKAGPSTTSDLPVDAPGVSSARVGALAPGSYGLWQLLRMWRRPVALGSFAVTVLALTGVMWWRSHAGTKAPDANAIVTASIAAEAAAPPPAANVALRRMLRFQVRRGSGQVEAEHEIDSWLFGASHRRVTRVLDASGHVVAGQWTDGARQTTTLGLGAWDEVWQRGLSAAVFRDRYMSGLCATSMDTGTYTIACAQHAPVTGLLQAMTPILQAQTSPLRPSRSTLVIRRTDWRPIRLVLELSESGLDRVVTLEERTHEQTPLSMVPSDVLAPAPTRVAPVTGTSMSSPRVRLAATPSLEIRLLELVDRLPGREYLSVARHHDRLVVTGLVADATQEHSLARAVAALAPDGPISTDVDTFVEAAARDRSHDPRAFDPTRVDVWEARAGHAPIETYLRARLPADRDVGAVVHELAPRVLTHARRARREAVALNALHDRFPEAVVMSFDGAGRSAWSALASRHLRAALDALAALDAALAPYIDRLPGDGPPTAQSVNDAIRRLSQEALTIEDLVTSSFSATNAAPGPSTSTHPVDVRQHVRRAEDAARALLDRFPS